MQINKFRNFVPNLSPHSLRLIRKMFVEHQNSKDELIKELESQVTLFEQIKIAVSIKIFVNSMHACAKDGLTLIHMAHFRLIFHKVISQFPVA